MKCTVEKTNMISGFVLGIFFKGEGAKLVV